MGEMVGMARGVEELEFGGSLYEAALSLRKAILRDPLGLEWTEEERALEPERRHFGLVEDGEVVACLSLSESCDGLKLRQMAVREDRQGRGCGRQLVEDVCERLRGEGVRELALHSREVAVGFYEALGFQRVGERFAEVGIPHWRMEIALR
jgi:predicted GNAT family N-acyltransferase